MAILPKLKRRVAGRNRPRWRRFRRGCSGTAALEFAIIGPIHITIILAILEAGLLCTRIALMDDAAAKAAKFVYLGPQGGQTVTRADLEEFICDQVERFMTNCETNLVVEMTTMSSFSSPPATSAPCRDSAVAMEPSVTYNTGGSSSIVFMRICMTTPVVTPGLGLGLSLAKTDTNKHQIVTAIAFANEPF